MYGRFIVVPLSRRKYIPFRIPGKSVELRYNSGVAFLITLYMINDIIYIIYHIS
jgi:hypothetical protein